MQRFPLIDNIRGFAVLAMMAYHFGFDLNMQGYISQDINHSQSWLVARTLIVTTFLFISGFSFALARHHSIQHHLMRLARIAGCACMVSIASYFMFPEAWIFFGVLHFVVVAGIVCWLLAPHEQRSLFVGMGILVLGLLYQSPVFDQPWLQWVGMMTHKPVTEDYVPVFPWLGVTLIGLYVGGRALKMQDSALLNRVPVPSLAPVGWLGRHSLAVYMLHQPIFLALLWFFGVVYR